jgi:hypothetical protein
MTRISRAPLESRDSAAVAACATPAHPLTLSTRTVCAALLWSQVGLCAVPPPRLRRSLLCLTNSCCIANTFADLRSRFLRLYARKAMLHHYTQVRPHDRPTSTSTLNMCCWYLKMSACLKRPLHCHGGSRTVCCMGPRRQ